MRSSWDIEGETLRSIFAHETPLAAGTVVPIDFSIDDGSFSYVSFIDVVSGRVDHAALRGKTVYVGPTAIELGDIVTVPVYRALPGVVVQAFATQTVRDGMLRPLPPGFYAVGLRSGRCVAHCCSAGVGGEATPRSSLRHSSCWRARRCCSTAPRASCSTWRRSRSRSSLRSSRRPCARSTSRRGVPSPSLSASSAATRCSAA